MGGAAEYEAKAAEAKAQLRRRVHALLDKWIDSIPSCIAPSDSGQESHSLTLDVTGIDFVDRQGERDLVYALSSETKHFEVEP